MTRVVVECPACSGTGTGASGRGLAIRTFVCNTCRGDRFVKARLWTEADSKRIVSDARAKEVAAAKRAEREERERELTNPKTHWNRIPLPEGWRTRHSLKFGLAPTRGNVRVVQIRTSRKYRVDVLDRENRKWEPVRNDKGRIVYTKVLPRAFAIAVPLYVPTPEEEAAEAKAKAEASSLDALRAHLKKHESALRACPHPSRYRRQEDLYSWAVWILDNRPHEANRVTRRVRLALNVAAPVPFAAAPTSKGGVADNLVSAMTSGSETDLTDSNAALGAAVGDA